MKTVILAGGIGSRISEESAIRPKPMIEIGGKPILWHIMKIYAAHGFDDFVVCLGYKGYLIKEYFLNYYLYNSDLTVKLRDNEVKVHFTNEETFTVTLIDTGLHTNTAGRLKQAERYLGGEAFMLTYGDGVANVDLRDLVAFHRSHGRLATLTAVTHPSRFGEIECADDGVVTSFREKAANGSNWINAGFFVLEPGIFEYLKGDMQDVQWERQPLIELARAGQLAAYKHHGFWKCMDAMRDKIELEALWAANGAEWKVW